MGIMSVLYQKGGKCGGNQMLNLDLKPKSSTWKCFSYVSNFYVCTKYLKEANEKET